MSTVELGGDSVVIWWGEKNVDICEKSEGDML